MPTFPQGQWSTYGNSGYDAALWRAANPPVDPYKTLQKGFAGAFDVTANQTIRTSTLGSGGAEAIFAFAVGGVFDTDRQRWIGSATSGHESAGTNEINEFDIATGLWNPSGTRPMNPTVELLSRKGTPWDPSIAYAGIHLSGPLGLVDVNDHYAAFGLPPRGGGSTHAVFPNPAQTYGSQCYIPAPFSSMFIWGGVANYDSNFGANFIYLWNTVNKQWQAQLVSNVPTGGAGAFPGGAVWDSTHNVVLFANGTNVLSFDPNTANVATVAAYPGGGVSNDETTAVWDPVRKRLWYFGGSAAGLQRYYDFSGGLGSNPAPVGFNIAGVGLTSTQGPGILYDPVIDKFVYFPGGTNITPNGSLVVIDPNTITGTVLSPIGGSVVPSTPNMGGAGTPGDGMWTRFFYASSIDAYVAIPQADDNSVFVFAPIRTAATPGNLMCSDLNIGKRTGNPDTTFGQTPNVDGVYVTVYGFGLGQPTDTVSLTVGGVACTIVDRGDCVAPRSPSLLKNTYMNGQMIVFQLNHACSTGAQLIQVTVNGTVVPGTLAFTVVDTGTIRVVSSNIQATFDSMVTNDVTYIGPGTISLPSLSLNNNTTGGQGQLAIGALPGANVTFGSTSADGIQIISTGGGQNCTYFKLNIRGAANINGPQAATLRSNCRLVGCNVQTPGAGGSSGAVGYNGNNVLLGANEATNCGVVGAAADQQYHVFYGGAQPNQGAAQTAESGRFLMMNYIHDNNSATRGFNNFSGPPGGTTPGNNQLGGIEIHHNVVVNQNWAAVGLTDGVIGTNLIHDNLFVRCGLNTGGAINATDYVIELSPRYQPDWTQPTQPIIVKVYGNTIVDGGDSSATSRGIYSLKDTTAASSGRPGNGWTFFCQGNIHYQSNGIQYVSSDSDTIPVNPAQISNNDWFAIPNLAPPTFESTGINVDPLFISPSTNNYHLQSNSPCKNGGVALGPDQDLDGRARPAAAPWDMGALQFTATLGPPLTLDMEYLGKAQDRVGTGPNSLAADGQLDGTFQVTVSNLQTRNITQIVLVGKNSGGTTIGTWDTTNTTNPVLGVAFT